MSELNVIIYTNLCNCNYKLQPGLIDLKLNDLI